MLVAIFNLVLTYQLASSIKPEASSTATCESLSVGSALLQQSSASVGTKFTAVQEADSQSRIHHGPAGLHDDKKKQAAVGIVASTVKCDRVGYAKVVQLKSDAQMKTFIRRVISSMGLLTIDEGPLNGLAPYYSGTKGYQSYEKLTKELRKVSKGPCSWLAPVDGGDAVFKTKKAALRELGCAVEISDSGYAKVAQRRSDDQMKTFILRVISNMGRQPVAAAENALNGLVPYYSGSVASQNFDALKSELQRLSTGQCSWLIPVNAKVPDGIGRAAPLSEPGYMSVAQTYNMMEMQDFVERVIADMKMEVVDENGLQGLIPYFDCEKDIKTFLQLKKELKQEAEKGAGAWLTLSGHEPDSAQRNPWSRVDDDRSEDEGTPLKNASPQSLKQWSQQNK